VGRTGFQTVEFPVLKMLCCSVANPGLDGMQGMVMLAGHSLQTRCSYYWFCAV
jgi:hypothetical protein